MITAMIIGKALSPFVALLIIWAVAAPVRRMVQQLPEGRIKRVLLARVN